MSGGCKINSGTTEIHSNHSVWCLKERVRGRKRWEGCFEKRQVQVLGSGSAFGDRSTVTAKGVELLLWRWEKTQKRKSIRVGTPEV